jgi:hypothetical protein
VTLASGHDMIVRLEERGLIMRKPGVPPSWWQQLLHNGTVFRLKMALRYRPGSVVVSVPLVLHG